MTPGIKLVRAEIETDVSAEASADVLKSEVTAALREVFESNILEDAKASCPVGTDPIKPGSTHNRDSLGVMVWLSPKGPMGKLFSTSGHGGFVEMGTRKMSPQPYAWPAVQTNIATIVTAIKDHLAAKVEPQKLGRVTVVEEGNIG